MAEGSTGFLVERWGLHYDAPMKRVVPLVVLTLTVLSLAPLPAAEGQAPERGPEFPNILLLPLDGGEPVLMETFRGRPALVTFWATWCGPCRAELPEIQRLYNELGGKGFVVVTINVDRSPAGVGAFMKRLDLALPVYRLEEGMLDRLGVRSIPMSVLVDTDGRVVRLYRGYSPGMVRELRRELEKLLGRDGSGEGA